MALSLTDRETIETALKRSEEVIRSRIGTTRKGASFTRWQRELGRIRLARAHLKETE